MGSLVPRANLGHRLCIRAVAWKGCYLHNLTVAYWGEEMRHFLTLSLAGLAMTIASGQARAATLIVDSTSVVYSGSPAVTASLHLTSPSKNYSSVYVSPQYLNGTLDGNIVQLFAYCVDILNYAGAGTFEVVTLQDYLGGNMTKYKQLAALIAAMAVR